MEKEKTLLLTGSYMNCMKEISNNGISNDTHWLVKKKTDYRIVYKCAQKECECVAELVSELINYDIIWKAYIIGVHKNHNESIPKPLKEHLKMAVAKSLISSSINIKESVTSEVKMQISRQTINRVKKSCFINGAWESLWKKLPSFVEVMNRDQTLSNLWLDEDGEIIAIFLTFPYVKTFCKSDAFVNLIFIDGTFCADHNKTTLLAATTVTSEKIILPLGVAVTSGETNDNYKYFLSQLKNYINDKKELFFMSDRHPSIISSINTIYPLSTLVPCAWHVHQHLHCPSVVFYQLILTDNIDLYEKRKSDFFNNYPASADKIKDIIDDMAIVKNNKTIFGYIADSPIESFNNAIKDYRNKEPLIMLYCIMQWALGQKERQLDYLKDNYLCDTAICNINNIKLDTHNISVKEQKDKTFIVIEIIKDNIEVCYKVKEHFNMIKCDCNGYERFGIPCRHEYAIADYYGLHAKLRKIAPFYETNVIRNSLSDKFECPYIGNLNEVDIKLPSINRRPGRPKTLRYRSYKENYMNNKNQRKCSVCGKYGHNNRTCPDKNDMVEIPNVVVPKEKRKIRQDDVSGRTSIMVLQLDERESEYDRRPFHRQSK